MDTVYAAVWGNGNLGTEAGILLVGTKDECRQAVAGFLADNNNPAVGAWVREERPQ